MARRLRHEELPFLTRAPVRQVHRGHVSLPADRVFAGLAERPEGWPAWFSWRATATTRRSPLRASAPSD